jgi:hypothetical protein
MKMHPAQSNRGVALVTTIIVVAIMATIAVALLQTTGTDRTSSRAVANNFQARLYAEAGLNAALSQLIPAAGPNMTLSLDRTNPEPSNWTLQYNTLALDGSILSSNSSQPTGLAPIADQTHTFTTPTGNKTVNKYPITITNEENEIETVGSFSYVVIDNTAKQSLFRFPEVTPRAYATSLNEVPFITSNLSVASGLTATAEDIASLPTPATANLLFKQDLGINSQWVDTKNYSPNLAPDGGPKLDLRRLKYYVDGLAISQSAGNPKSQVVEALVGQTSSVNATSAWGGGRLTWLSSPQNPRAYTLTEARQIAANLIDYIDHDLHPTTDNLDNPTYFGTEARLKANGIQGHPYVTAVGCGLVFNLSGAAGSVGALNSTRVLSFWSLVNPWSNDIDDFHTFYSVEITISVTGSAAGGNLGNNATSYFQKVLNERLNEGPANGDSGLKANEGSTFPQTPSGMSFANFYSLQNTAGVGRQPAGMTFSNIEFKIDKMRLVYKDTDGLSSVVQVLDKLSGTPIPLHLTTFTLPASQGSTTYSPGTVRNALFLNGDPRLNFNSSQWVAGQITQASANSSNPPEKDGAPVNVFAGMNEKSGDGRQELPSDHTWYSSDKTENHFFVRSPPKIASDPTNTLFDPSQNPNGQVAVESLAEVCYLSTGLPWQTLRMVVDPQNVSEGGDYFLMDFLDTGTFPRKALTAAGLTGNQTVVNGRINPNTLLGPTATGLFQNIPDLSSEEATNLAEFLTTTSTPTGYPYTRPGALGAVPEMATPGATTKFAREDLIRRISNLLTTQSTDFTILSHGEAINPRNKQVLTSTAMESTVRVLSINGTTKHIITSRKLE